MTITDLPDYSALKKLAAALWKQDNTYHGSAIMVGAGFSRSAATGNASKKLPLWAGLSLTLAKDLNASANLDPLRLAEEYYAYFGKQALHDLIKNEVNDAAWMPGEMYKALLELPWTEVLTTNWDTLLERAAMEVHWPVYSVVSRQEDLSSARSPRIVKLHGTINITEDLIFTQEDYRKYPQKNAAFVNFARQVFIENELCLLGFSGDDPNFLQWAGWVRDQLTVHARRIYLVGALNLTAARRKYLESINVSPIDLGDLVVDYDDHDTKHAIAAEYFLKEMRDLKPRQAWEWSPAELRRSTVTIEELDKTSGNHDYAATLLERQIPALELDRESYPGWLVCPEVVRRKLENQIDDPYPSARNIPRLSPDGRAKLLYEIAWRHSVTYNVTMPWLAQELLKICDPRNPCVLRKKQQMEIALHLLKNTYWFDRDDVEAKSIAQKATSILEENTKYWPEIVNELAFYQAAIARDCFDYLSIEILVDRISGKLPEWKIKKASLLAELGRFDEGEVLIAEAYRELLVQYRNNRNSIYIFSRLSWAHWLLRGVRLWELGKPLEEFPSVNQDAKCDPWDYIQRIQERISRSLEKQQGRSDIEPLFEPGHYRDNSNTVTFGGDFPILLFEGVSSSAGIPLRWYYVSFLVEPASRLAGLDEIDNQHRFSLAIRAANSEDSETLKKVFSRIQIACLTQSEADQLLNRCDQAINYWMNKGGAGSPRQKQYAIDRLRVFIEVYARVMVRASPVQAKSAFRLAMRLAKIPQLYHLWLFDSLSHLVEYALKSIPESEHPELLLDALLFPLQAEIGVEDHGKWPNPVIECPGERGLNAVLDRRIDEIIDLIKPCSSVSGSALLRLLPLVENNFLKDEEKKKISEKIWGNLADHQSLPETGLLKHALLKLPSPDQSITRALVRRFLFEANDESLFEVSFLKNIAYAAQAEGVKEFPDEKQSSDYFGRLVEWRMGHKDDPFGFAGQQEKQKGKYIGKVFAVSIVPSLPSAALTEENFEKLYSFYSEVYAPETVMALVYFAQKNVNLSGRLGKIIRKGMQDHDPDNVACSAYALLKWRELSNSATVEKLISRLIYLIESGRMVGLSTLLVVANKMYNSQWLSEEDVAVLTDSLPVVFGSADYKHYKRLHNASRKIVTVSLVRAACVRLARDILNKTHGKNSELLRVLDEARRDPLPEVRYAEIT